MTGSPVQYRTGPILTTDPPSVGYKAIGGGRGGDGDGTVAVTNGDGGLSGRREPRGDHHPDRAQVPQDRKLA